MEVQIWFPLALPLLVHVQYWLDNSNVHWTCACSMDPMDISNVDIWPAIQWTIPDSVTTGKRHHGYIYIIGNGYCPMVHWIQWTFKPGHHTGRNSSAIYCILFRQTKHFTHQWPQTIEILDSYDQCEPGIISIGNLPATEECMHTCPLQVNIHVDASLYYIKTEFTVIINFFHAVPIVRS